MKKILGLDLGSSSIGWAVITETEESMNIEGLGSRIIPLSTDDANEFTRGKDISKNAKRTQRRTLRKGYDRYQQRRENLKQFLHKNNMLPCEELKNLDKLSLWSLRARAAEEQLLLPEIGRVLYHINQKRGYKATKADYDAGADKTQGDYVKSVMGRHKEVAERGITIGQLFFERLSEDHSYRIKEQVFPRKAYEEEFDRIISCQRVFYPSVFTEESIDLLRNRIIFYQRGLKSCKYLVSVCKFEKRAYVNAEGKTVFSGPRVAPRSSPLAQLCKIWESVNNLTLKNRKGDTLEISPAQRGEMVEHLNHHDRLTLADVYRILGISKSDGWWGGKTIGKGLQGNITRSSIRKAIGGDYEELLRFDLRKADTNLVDEETGEIVQIISEDYLDEPLYRLWHAIYSIPDKDHLTKTLFKQFGIADPCIIDNLFALDFVKAGYANKSAKTMRRILPYLKLGLMYSEACEAAGFRHSDSLTREESATRELKKKLKQIEKNELRQPVVEKILNQMINVVNALMDKHGHFDEIRVELARELKQSKDERKETTKRISRNERENKSIAERIAEEYNLTPTRSRIQKYKMWNEADHTCFYCGQPVGVIEFLRGFEVEVEHIIPRSLFFDDSFSNKVCSCRKCNKEKNNRTAYDYMKSKSDGELGCYLERIENLYKNKKISKTKYERLLTAGDNIPADFIDRQLRESQYIARKSREILSDVCRNVTSTSGSVTDFIRRTWGWDKVLHSLNFERCKAAGLTNIIEREHNGIRWSEEVIQDWSKRLDHRHHAIDALVIACTKQGYIQRINNMSALKDEVFAPMEKQGGIFQDRKTLLEKYIESRPHFTTSEVEKAVDSVLVSFKSGKKATSTGKRYVYRRGKRVTIQENVIIPRGALHEESLYGMIGCYVKNKKGETVIEQKSVLRYALSSIVRKDIEFIVDRGIRKLVKQRFENHSGPEKDIWKDMENNPLLLNGIPVKSVRCYTGLKPEATVKLGRGYVKPGNNHHIALYRDRDGKYHESCVTFWHAAERKKYGLPIVITEPEKVWDGLKEGLPENFLDQLPLPDYSFEVSLQQNEMFLIGIEPEMLEEAIANRNYSLLNKYLYRVQKITSNNYYFRLHTEAKLDDTKEGKAAKKFYRLSRKGFFEACPQKVRISLLGEITKI